MRGRRRDRTSPRSEHRKLSGDARSEEPIIHIAAIGTAGRSRNGLAERRRDAEAADHRSYRDRPILKSRRRFGETRDSEFEIELPNRTLALRQASTRLRGRPHCWRPGRRSNRSVRVGVMRSIRTSTASPGSAPLTKNGPVSGLGRVAICYSGRVEAPRIDSLRNDQVAVVHRVDRIAMPYGVVEDARQDDLTRHGRKAFRLRSNRTGTRRIACSTNSVDLVELQSAFELPGGTKRRSIGASISFAIDRCALGQEFGRRPVSTDRPRARPSEISRPSFLRGVVPCCDRAPAR